MILWYIYIWRFNGLEFLDLTMAFSRIAGVVFARNYERTLGDHSGFLRRP